MRHRDRNSLYHDDLARSKAVLTRPPGPISFTPLTRAPVACTNHAEPPRPTPQENVMKRLAFVAAVLAVVAACSKSEANKDTTPPAMAPAPSAAATDTGMKMDTSNKMNMDTTKKDT